MAWIEDHCGNVLLVKQATGRKAWSFPGGKVKQEESLIEALRRELLEELNLRVDVATPIDLFDRAEKSNLTILFRVILVPKSIPVPRKGEIEKVAFFHAPPRLSTPSLRFFWQRSRRSFEPLSSLTDLT